MRYPIVFSVALLSLGAVTAAGGAQAAAHHHRHPAHAMASAGPAPAAVDTMVSTSRPANVRTGLDCNNVPENSLEYYCNHRDQFPGQ